MNSDIGDEIDANMTQENIDCKQSGVEEHPSFEFINPENLNLEDKSTQDSTYRKIDLLESSKLSELTKQLDPDHRAVLDKAVAYAKDIVKSKILGLIDVKPPL